MLKHVKYQKILQFISAIAISLGVLTQGQLMDYVAIITEEEEKISFSYVNGSEDTLWPSKQENN